MQVLHENENSELLILHKIKNFELPIFTANAEFLSDYNT